MSEAKQKKKKKKKKKSQKEKMMLMLMLMLKPREDSVSKNIAYRIVQGFLLDSMMMELRELYDNQKL